VLQPPAPHGKADLQPGSRHTRESTAGVSIVDPDCLGGIGRGLEDDSGNGVIAAKVMQFDRPIVAVIRLQEKRTTSRRNLELNRKFPRCLIWRFFSNSRGQVREEKYRLARPPLLPTDAFRAGKAQTQRRK